MRQYMTREDTIERLEAIRDHLLFEGFEEHDCFKSINDLIEDMETRQYYPDSKGERNDDNRN